MQTWFHTISLKITGDVISGKDKWYGNDSDDKGRGQRRQTEDQKWGRRGESSWGSQQTVCLTYMRIYSPLTVFRTITDNASLFQTLVGIPSMTGEHNCELWLKVLSLWLTLHISVCFPALIYEYWWLLDHHNDDNALSYLNNVCK